MSHDDMMDAVAYTYKTYGLGVDLSEKSLEDTLTEVRSAVADQGKQMRIQPTKLFMGNLYSKALADSMRQSMARVAGKAYRMVYFDDMYEEGVNPHVKTVKRMSLDTLSDMWAARYGTGMIDGGELDEFYAAAAARLVYCRRMQVSAPNTWEPKVYKLKKERY